MLPLSTYYYNGKVKAHKSTFLKDIVIITDAVGLDEKQLKDSDVTNSPLFIIPKAEQKNNVSIDSVFIHKTLDNFYEISVQISGYGNDF